MGDACGQADEAGVEPAANPLATVLRQVDQSCRALPDALGGIPEERLTVAGAVGELPIKDVMAHVAFWDDHAVVVQRIRAGEPLRDDDWQAMNAQEADARAGHVAAERRTVMERAHQAVTDLLRATPRSDTAPACLCGCMEGDTYQHLEEQASDIRDRRARVGL